jgi:DNA-binding NarL/FixJ family response regulator
MPPLCAEHAARRCSLASRWHPAAAARGAFSRRKSASPRTTEGLTYAEIAERCSIKTVEKHMSNALRVCAAIGAEKTAHCERNNGAWRR